MKRWAICSATLTPLLLLFIIGCCVQQVKAPAPPFLYLFEPVIDELSVTMNGVVTPGTGGSYVTRVHWNWGDGCEEDHWMFNVHNYTNYGTYTLTVTAYQSDGMNATETKTIALHRHIYIKAVGNVDPPTAPIETLDNMTYTMVGDINTSIIIERSNVVIDGAGHHLRGTRVYNSQGISIDRIYNITIRDMKIEGYWYGIGLWYSSNDNIYGNSITVNSDCGIKVYYSSNNTIRENNLADNKYGIWLDESSGNSIYRNNFLGNLLNQVYTKHSVDSWDNGAEGNYWSTYYGQDVDQNGIGDSPYIVSMEENVQDYCPLLEPWSQSRIFDIPYGEEVYRVAISSNSTVAGLIFNRAGKQMSFKATGSNGKSGFCNVTIPKILLAASLDEWVVRIDDQIVTFEAVENATHTFIGFAFTHSTRTVSVEGTSSINNIQPVAGPVWTQLWFWVTIILGGIAVLTVSFAVRYYRGFENQRRMSLEYESNLETLPISNMERARTLIINDVVKRKEKLEKFEKKHGIRIHTANTLEEITKKLGIQTKH